MPLTSDPSAKRSAIKITLSAIALSVAGLILVHYFRASAVGGDTIQLWYYDLNMCALARAGGSLSPTRSVHGSEVVRAYVFSCGECNDPGKRYIGWLEQFSSEAKAALQSKTRISTYLGPTGLENMNDADISALVPPGSRQIRQVDASEWVDFDSPEAVQVRERARSKCGGDTDPIICDQADFNP